MLVLSIWWKRTNAWGAMAGMLAGLGTAALAILLGEAGAWPLPSVLAGAVGLAGRRSRHHRRQHAHAGASHERHLDMLHEIRVPGGETLYDRELRLQRLKTRRAGLRFPPL